MKITKNYQALIVSIFLLIIMLLSVLIWNKIIIKQNNLKEENSPTLDVSDANNIPSIEKKLGEDIKITQSYLLTYTRRKSNTWYYSKGYVKNIKIQDSKAIIIFNSLNDNNLTITGTIDTEKWHYKKGDLLYFVGTLNLNTYDITLSKISNEEINYQNITEINLDEFINTIDKLKKNYFLISGYMITDQDKYKLFDSKESYKKDSSISTYFTLSWKNEFNFTGNQFVNIKCQIADTYKLKNCELINN